MHSVWPLMVPMVKSLLSSCPGRFHKSRLLVRVWRNNPEGGPQKAAEPPTGPYRENTPFFLLSKVSFLDILQKRRTKRWYETAATQFITSTALRLKCICVHIARVLPCLAVAQSPTASQNLLQGEVSWGKVTNFYTLLAFGFLQCNAGTIRGNRAQRCKSEFQDPMRGMYSNQATSRLPAHMLAGRDNSTTLTGFVLMQESYCKYSNKY